MTVNEARGEASLTLHGRTVRLRPSFNALVAAEAELGSLFALVERAASGSLSLSETATLLWHCAEDAGDRDAFGDALVAAGLAAATPALKQVLRQILAGR